MQRAHPTRWHPRSQCPAQNQTLNRLSGNTSTSQHHPRYAPALIHTAPSPRTKALDDGVHDDLVGQLAKAAAKPRSRDLRAMLTAATLSQRDVLLEDILGQTSGAAATQPGNPQARKRRRGVTGSTYAGGGTPGASPALPSGQPASGSGRSRFSKEQQRMHMVPCDTCMLSNVMPDPQGQCMSEGRQSARPRRRTLLELLDTVEAAMSRRNLHHDFDDKENRADNAGHGPQAWMCSQQGVFDFEGADSVLEELQAELVAQLEHAASNGGRVGAHDVKGCVEGGCETKEAPAVPASQGACMTAAVALKAVRGDGYAALAAPVVRLRLRVLEVALGMAQSTLRVVDEGTVCCHTCLCMYRHALCGRVLWRTWCCTIAGQTPTCALATRSTWSQRLRSHRGSCTSAWGAACSCSIRMSSCQVPTNGVVDMQCVDR